MPSQTLMLLPTTDLRSDEAASLRGKELQHRGSTGRSRALDGYLMIVVPTRTPSWPATSILAMPPWMTTCRTSKISV